MLQCFYQQNNTVACSKKNCDLAHLMKQRFWCLVCQMLKIQHLAHLMPMLQTLSFILLFFFFLVENILHSTWSYFFSYIYIRWKVLTFVEHSSNFDLPKSPKLLATTQMLHSLMPCSWHLFGVFNKDLQYSNFKFPFSYYQIKKKKRVHLCICQNLALQIQAHMCPARKF